MVPLNALLSTKELGIFSEIYALQTLQLNESRWYTYKETQS